VVGFPHGSCAVATKLAELRFAIAQGASELDVVINISQVLSGELQAVDDEIGLLTRACHDQDRAIKIILETCFLNDAQKLALAGFGVAHGADWLKTSTGFGPAGALPQDVALLRGACPPEVQIKASGGIRTLSTTQHFLALGASRIGTSCTEAIASELARLEDA
jgi:deoxyribose-phosphate aldolase